MDQRFVVFSYYPTVDQFRFMCSITSQWINVASFAALSSHSHYHLSIYFYSVMKRVDKQL
jgi:hypothetical protein